MRPKSAIHTPKRDDEHPPHFYNGVTPTPPRYLTIIRRARMGSKSIAHEAEGQMGY